MKISNSSAIDIKPTSYSAPMLSPDLRETFCAKYEKSLIYDFSYGLVELSTTTSRPERERVRLAFQAE